jgi:hypothetical protein
MPVTLVLSYIPRVTLSSLAYVRNTDYLAHRHDKTGPLVHKSTNTGPLAHVRNAGP